MLLGCSPSPCLGCSLPRRRARRRREVARGFEASPHWEEARPRLRVPMARPWQSFPCVVAKEVGFRSRCAEMAASECRHYERARLRFLLFRCKLLRILGFLAGRGWLPMAVEAAKDEIAVRPAHPRAAQLSCFDVRAGLCSATFLDRRVIASCASPLSGA